MDGDRASDQTESWSVPESVIKQRDGLTVWQFKTVKMQHDDDSVLAEYQDVTKETVKPSRIFQRGLRLTV